MRPPEWKALLGSLFGSPEGQGRLQAIVEAQLGPSQKGRYRHWDILRHLAPPTGLSVEEWWIGTKFARHPLYQPLPMLDRNGAPFKYASLDLMHRMLHDLDKHATGSIRGTEQVTDPQTRDRYLFQSLVEESITSSQLEGAATTREVAKEMIRSGRAPRDRSEQMIANNYQAMQFMRRLGDQPLTPEIVVELQRQVTIDTLEESDVGGRLRRADEPIVVEDESGRVLHQPPAADQLPARLAAMCSFANTADAEPFIHPAVRAILLHLWLAYDHPFVDGNGRTARALFYWSMSRQGYWLCEFLSISRILKRAPGRYYRAFLYTETDEGDATYFILNQLQVILTAVDELHVYLARKATELRDTEALLRQSRLKAGELNHRQLALVHHAIRHPLFIYTFESHRVSHNVTYQTARTDLLGLEARRLLSRRTVGRKFQFISPPDLGERLRHLATNPATRPASPRNTSRAND